MFSTEVRLTSAQAGRTGKITLAVNNQRTGQWVEAPARACGAAGTCSSTTLKVKLNDRIVCAGMLFVCDGSRHYEYDEVPNWDVRIKTGACGDPGEDFDLLLTKTVPGGQEEATFGASFAVTQAILDWINRQKSKGRRASCYTQMSVDYTGWYSGEVQFEIEGGVTVGGWATLKVINERIGKSIDSFFYTPQPYCPWQGGICGTDALQVQVGDIIRCVGALKKCDGSAWGHSEIGVKRVQIISGTCGGSGETNLVLAEIMTKSTSDGNSMYETDFQISQNMVDNWINLQAKSTIYAVVT